MNKLGVLLVMVVMVVRSNAKTLAIATSDAAASSCTTPQGDVLALGKDKLIVGERTCTILHCGTLGLNTLNVECVAPQCVQPIRKSDACCYSCPSGHNCRLPGSGEVIQASTGYRNATHVCTCPPIRGLGWGQDLLTAQCQQVTTTTTTTTTTTPPPQSAVCILPKNSAGVEEQLARGQTKVVSTAGGCDKYQCDESGKLTLYRGECAAVQCDYPVRKPGQCCPTCPEDSTADGEPTTYSRNVTIIRVTWSGLLNTLLRHFGISLGLTPAQGQGQVQGQGQGQGHGGWSLGGWTFGGGWSKPSVSVSAGFRRVGSDVSGSGSDDTGGHSKDVHLGQGDNAVDLDNDSGSHDDDDDRKGKGGRGSWGGRTHHKKNCSKSHSGGGGGGWKTGGNR